MIDIRTLIFDKKLNQRTLAQIIGCQQSEVSLFANRKRVMSDEQVQALISHFGKETIDAYTIPNNPLTTISKDGKIKFLDKQEVEELREEVIEEVRAEEIKTTLVLPPDVVRNPDINIKKDIKAGKLKQYVKPVQDILPNDTIKVYTYCDDMEPEIRAGEPVLVQLLPSDLPVNPGQMYFIDLRSGGIIRYIEREKDGKLYLKARNSSYGDMVVAREDVQSLSLVRIILRSPRSMSNKETTLAEMVKSRDEHMSDMLATNTKLIDELCKRNERTDKMMDELLKK